jgi:hypothetical protein
MQESTFNDTNQNINYTVSLEEEGDDIMMPIPEDLLDYLGWEDGDLLEWILEDDHIKLVKVEEE